MKRFPHMFWAALLPLALGAPLAAAQAADGPNLYPEDAPDRCILGLTQIRITVKNITNQGLVKLDFFDREELFMKSRQQFRVTRVPAKAPEVIVCVNVPAAGDYAVVGYQDLDGDRKLDKKFGIFPDEPVGMSSDIILTRLRKPEWNEAVFFVPAHGKNIDITMRMP